MIKTHNKNTQELVMQAVNELVDFVKPTYGPASNKVLIHKPYSSQVIDDGVAIARAYESEDPIKNAIISVIKEVAVKTNDRVGDGTTSSLIILQALMQEIYRSNKSPREIVDELKEGVEQAKKQLTGKSLKIKSLADLTKIARISYDNPQVAAIIAELIYELGPSGVITTEESGSTDITSERVEGLEVDSGFVSPYMVNSEKIECVLKKPMVLITDYRFTSGPDMLTVLEKVHATGCRNLFIIAEHVEGEALNTIVVNRIKGAMEVLAIDIPRQLLDKTEFVQDIAMITGANPITIDKNFDFANIALEDFGSCDKVISKRDKTLIIGGAGEPKDIKKAIKSLQEMIKEAKDSYEKEKLEKRLAKFTDGVAVIRVGAATEGELKALKFKVEDAINAVKSAYRSGVVCGAGLSLARCYTDSSILNKALKYPFRQLCENSDLNIEVSDIKETHAINAVTKEIGDYYKLGIIDPVEVLCAGMESAVSIASLLITMKGIVYEAPEDKKE